jgi:hypothetical protein
MSIPALRYHGIVLDYAGLRYNPVDDIIHPSVVRVGSRWHLYYAPHDAPGGVCLATADALAGPWTEHAGNPLIARDWPPHYAVSHVSSPHALWIGGRLFLYFHGENDTTRYAVSDDGIHFTYGGVAVTTADFGDDVTEASYARVFAHGDGYAMLLMGNQAGTRKVFLATSPDGAAWTARRDALLTPPPDTDQMGPGWLFPWEGRHYILAFANPVDSPALYDPYSDLHLYTVDAALTAPVHQGTFLAHTAAGSDNMRLSDPCLVVEDGKWHLFVNVGRRRNQRIGLFV